MRELVSVCVKLLEGMFFAGILGSAVVVLLMTVEDVRVMFEKDERPSPPV